MSEKHYPYIGGGFDRIIFDGDESVWVPEAENAKLRELVADMLRAMRRMEASAGMDALVGHSAWFAPKLQELGIEVPE